MIYLRLFWEFFKTGLFAVGGGLATIPFLQEMSEKTGWFSLETLADMIAVSESTPGPIGVNMASYVGFTVKGIPGTIVATLSLILPSLIVILIIAKILEKFKGNKYVDYAFYGLRAASVALITNALIEVLKIALLNTEAFALSGVLLDLLNYKALILAAVIYICYTKIKGHPIIYLGVSALIGIIFNFA